MPGNESAALEMQACSGRNLSDYAETLYFKSLIGAAIPGGSE
jgi:hypothetical protein